MPKVAYSREEREKIRAALVAVALAKIASQGVLHTTVEEIYMEVGISRTFFYSFFPTKEELIVEALYLQQPRVLAYARALMEDPELSWREGVRRFFHACCYGERHGIAVLTVEEQQRIFHRLSPEGCEVFREKQFRLFQEILRCFGVRCEAEQVRLLTNLSLSVMVLRRAIPDTLPLFVPEAADAAADIQIEAIVDYLERMRESSPL